MSDHFDAAPMIAAVQTALTELRDNHDVAVVRRAVMIALENQAKIVLAFGLMKDAFGKPLFRDPGEA